MIEIDLLTLHFSVLVIERQLCSDGAVGFHREVEAYDADTE